MMPFKLRASLDKQSKNSVNQSQRKRQKASNRGTQNVIRVPLFTRLDNLNNVPNLISDSPFEVLDTEAFLPVALKAVASRIQVVSGPIFLVVFQGELKWNFLFTALRRVNTDCLLLIHDEDDQEEATQEKQNREDDGNCATATSGDLSFSEVMPED